MKIVGYLLLLLMAACGSRECYYEVKHYARIENLTGTDQTVELCEYSKDNYWRGYKGDADLDANQETRFRFGGHYTARSINYYPGSKDTCDAMEKTDFRDVQLELTTKSFAEFKLCTKEDTLAQLLVNLNDNCPAGYTAQAVPQTKCDEATK